MSGRRPPGAGPGLEVQGLVVRFGDVAAVAGVDLAVATGEVVCLLGPSGCGKSTLLRTVAGLEQPSGGRVCWDGVDLAGVPVHRRRFGLMFQDYALFPHLDVAGNVGFGLRMQGREVARRTAEVLAMVGMEGTGHRRVATLSGGEQQRVALARALAPEPRLLLLDEPLAALDRALRARLLAELAEILGRLGVTALHVTHDQEEAFALGDRIAVMDAGRILQAGTPSEVWTAPASPTVARFLGFPVADVTVCHGVATGPWGPVRVPPGTPDGPATLALRPEALALAPAGGGDPDGAGLRGDVTSTTFRGDRVVVRVRTPGGPLDVAAAPPAAPAVGATVTVTVDPAGAVVLPVGS